MLNTSHQTTSNQQPEELIALLTAVRAGDETAVPALQDWFEEHSDYRAETVRRCVEHSTPPDFRFTLCEMISICLLCRCSTCLRPHEVLKRDKNGWPKSKKRARDRKCAECSGRGWAFQTNIYITTPLTVDLALQAALRKREKEKSYTSWRKPNHGRRSINP